MAKDEHWGMMSDEKKKNVSSQKVLINASNYLPKVGHHLHSDHCPAHFPGKPQPGFSYWQRGETQR